MKDWLLTDAIETDEKMATGPAGLGYHSNRSNVLLLERGGHTEARLGEPVRRRCAG